MTLEIFVERRTASYPEEQRVRRIRPRMRQGGNTGACIEQVREYRQQEGGQHADPRRTPRLAGHDGSPIQEKHEHPDDGKKVGPQLDR